MNALQHAVMIKELESARKLCGESIEGLDRLRSTARITGGVDLRPINLACFHLTQVLSLLDKSMAAEKVGTVGSTDPQNVGCNEPLPRLPGEGSAQELAHVVPTSGGSGSDQPSVSSVSSSVSSVFTPENSVLSPQSSALE